MSSLFFRLLSVVAFATFCASAQAQTTCDTISTTPCGIWQDTGVLTGTPVLGVNGALSGTLGFRGVTSGTATITPQNVAGTPTLVLPNASGTLAAGASAPLALDAATGTLSLSGVVALANGGTGQATKSAAFNALSPLTTQGDMLYGGAAGTGIRLPAGTSSQVLTGGATPSWSAATSWFDAAYCNTVGYLIARTTGAWTCSKAIAANPVWWGADPTGAGDSTTAFNSAIAANASVEFPAGKFRFNSALSYTLPNSLASVSIKGQGADNTILYWPNAAGGLTINYVHSDNTAHVRDLSFTTGVAGGGTGLTFTSTAHTQGISDIYRVSFRGDDGFNVTYYWNLGVWSHYITNLNVDGLGVYGQGATGAGTLHGTAMQIEGNPSGTDYAVQVNVSKSVFEFLDTGIFYNSYLQGITVDQTNFTIVKNGIISNSSETGVLAQLAVTNSQFGLFNSNSAGIVTLTPILQTQIANNFFFIDWPPAAQLQSI